MVTNPYHLCMSGTGKQTANYMLYNNEYMSATILLIYRNDVRIVSLHINTDKKVSENMKV